jgi:molybdenum cofactor guanylyltransferase
VSGILLAGGASRRFGSPKELAELEGVTLLERAWRLLGEVCDERLVVGGDGLADPGTGPVAAIAVGLRAATQEVAVVIPVDMPLLTTSALRLLANACRDAATAQHGPLPCAVARRTLPAFETGERRLRAVLDGLDTSRIKLDERLLANVNEPGDLRKIAASEDHRTRGET